MAKRRWIGGALASFFLAALPTLRLANRTGFVGDEFDKAVSERPTPLPTRVGWLVYAGGTLISLFSAMQILSPGVSMPTPQETTAVFAIPFVSAGISLVVSVPLFRAARRRWRPQEL